ncbi:anti-sigma factor family protein [Corynebacterium wankanglinii]|uniref:Anti-sigma factor n=1 Tax=Corynebacterium wankanglinii TaxID=2735136 RepID=A0A838CJX9_9CORY|nr:anti-sigma factor [Corynebacterium wankanglinii]MBA1835501.1 anti-sigma factor [Corynebacterium wankanglinii]
MARREFNSTDHLNPEAVAAFVDGELSDSAFHRAAKHLADCDECRAEVDCQRKAANRLRVVDDSGVHAPASLVERLAGLRADDLAGETVGDARRGEAAREKLGRLGNALQSSVQSSLSALKRRGE